MSSPSISPSPTSPTSTPAASNSPGSTGGAPATSTLLFGFLVIFAALFAAFLFLVFFWKIQRRRQTTFLPEFDDIRGSNRGVPKLWEAWVRDEPSEKEWNWGDIATAPLSIDVGRVPSEQTVSSPTSRSRRLWPFSLFRRRPLRPARSQAAQQQQQQQLNVHGVMGTEEARTATGFINGVRVSCVIMMPHSQAETSDRRRRSEISQVVEQQQNWRRREYAIGIYHPSFREGWTL